MNQHPGVIGRKVGMTQVFSDDGSVVACTVIESLPVVVGKRTQKKDGYDALIIGMSERKEKHTSVPLGGFYKKQGVSPKRDLKELRCSAEYAAQFEVGQELKLDSMFSAGQYVDVQGVSRGRGFSGVMRRYNFRGQTQTHGTHEYKRHGGSIGTNMTPGRVWPGVKMAGQYGNKTCSVLNQRVVKVMADEHLVLIRGAVPGPKNGLVVVRGAIKKSGGKA
jgi:large subunit ribosomal protein L3